VQIGLPYVQINFSSPAHMEIMANGVAGSIPKTDTRERCNGSQTSGYCILIAGEVDHQRM
jgi:hypothetical protein